MMRLSEVKYSFSDVLDECSNGILRNKSLEKKLKSNKQAILDEGKRYSSLAANGTLFSIKATPFIKGTDPIVLSDLTKSDFSKLYDTYFVDEEKPARKIYETIMNSAREKCPFCGGIGTPRNLDHFLPKAHFPQFSVLPQNLVPSCRDCNMDGEIQGFATVAEDQLIQPYVDADHFFYKQWIFAKYSKTLFDDDPGDFHYFTSPPADWSDVDKKRVERHFNEFNIAKRYATKASEHLGVVRGQVRLLKTKANFDDTAFIIEFLQASVDSSPFPNHWQRGMFQALIGSLK